MKKDLNIKIAGYFLLILYFIGISPSFVIHQHDNNIIPFANATRCERVIYDSTVGASGKYAQHVSRIEKDCWLCDHHTVTPQILFDFSFHIEPLTVFSVRYFSYYQNIHPVALGHSTGRGPPLA